MVSGIARGKAEDALYLLSAVVRGEMLGDLYRKLQALTSPNMESPERCPVEAQGRGLEAVFPQASEKKTRGLYRGRVLPEGSLVLKKHATVAVGSIVVH